MPFVGQLVQIPATWTAEAGVYGIANQQRQIIYVGQTDNLQRRMAEHDADTSHPMHSYAPKYAFVEIIPQKRSRDLREAQLIAEYNPPCNQQHPTGR